MSQTRDRKPDAAAPSAVGHTALAGAVEIARAAPSVHNTQPWRWRLGDGGWLQLRAERRRQLAVADPDGRLLTQSCGAALHHVRLALAAAGSQATVDRLPDASDPDLLATIRLGGGQEPDPQAASLLSCVSLRRTDRRPVTDRPVQEEALEAIRAAAEGEGTHLHLLRRENVVELTQAMSQADTTEVSEMEHRTEIAAWIGGDRPDRTGVPSNAIPDQPLQTRVQLRYFGPPGTLPSDGGGHDASATYAILHGEADTAQAWLRAGEALSACWLTAMRHGVSVLPITAVVEVLSTRLVLTRMLSGLGNPYLAMRLGHPDPAIHLPPAPPRLPTADILEDADEGS